MAWNIRLPGRMSATRAASFEPASPSAAEIAPSARAPLLAVFRRLAVLLELTAATAQRTGQSEQHAAFGARLAIFRARVEAGETSASLATALARFGVEFEAFTSVALGCRRP
jgi:hypothetical protein